MPTTDDTPLKADELFSYLANPDREGQTLTWQDVCVAHEPSLDFSLLRPLGIELATPSAFVLGPLFELDPLEAFGLECPGQKPRLGVSALELGTEVDPMDWLRWHAEQLGWTVLLRRVHAGEGGLRYEIGAIREGVVRRTMVQRSGSRLVRCDAVAARRDWATWRDALWVALESFRLTNPNTDLADELVPMTGPLVWFALPRSWAVTGRGVAGESMVWAAEPRQEGSQTGMKLVAQQCTSRRDARQRRADFWREMQAVGRIGEVEAVPRDGAVSGVHGWLGQWRASVTRPEGQGALVFVQLEFAGLSVDCSLLSPAPEAAPLESMRAARALDIVVAKCRPRFVPGQPKR